MGWQPSASKTEILLLCQRPFDPTIEAAPDEPGEPARYGSAWHQVTAACLKSPKKKLLEKTAAFARAVTRAARDHDVKDAADELAGHVKSSVKVLRNWLTREKLEIAEVEKAYAVWPHPNGWTSRAIEAHDEDHVYKSAPGEIPGTVDLVARNSSRSRIAVIDHKTGYVEDWFASDDFVGFARPTTVAQMRTLGLAVEANEIGIFHADRKGLPIVYSEPYELSERRKHNKELYAALNRVGQGFLRPGPYCKRCPARVGCPARAADLLVESAEVLVKAANAVAIEPVDPNALFALPTEPSPEGMLEMRAGALYDMLKRFRELEKAGTAELRRLVKAGAIIETRDGKVLSIREQTYESLSKKSVLEALGKVAGEKELARLRKKGAIREATREMLVGEK